MEQNRSWEADSLSPKKGIARILWNPKFHYHLHKILPLFPILSQINPVQSIPFYLLKLHFNIKPELLLKKTGKVDSTYNVTLWRVRVGSNVYTHSDILTAWYHFTQTKHFYGNLI